MKTKSSNQHKRSWIRFQRTLSLGCYPLDSYPVSTKGNEQFADLCFCFDLWSLFTEHSSIAPHIALQCKRHRVTHSSALLVYSSKVSVETQSGKLQTESVLAEQQSEHHFRQCSQCLVTMATGTAKKASRTVQHTVLLFFFVRCLAHPFSVSSQSQL